MLVTSTPGSDAVSEPLREQIQEVIATRIAEPIRGDLVKLLARPGSALHPDGLCRAGVLALKVHEAVIRDAVGRAGLLAAAAVELQMEAADVFDEVADAAPGSNRSEDLGPAIALLTAGAAGGRAAGGHSPPPSPAICPLSCACTRAGAGPIPCTGRLS